MTTSPYAFAPTFAPVRPAASATAEPEEIATAPPTDTEEVEVEGGEEFATARPEDRPTALGVPEGMMITSSGYHYGHKIPSGYALVGKGYCHNGQGTIPPLCGFKASDQDECTAECDNAGKGCIGSSLCCI